MHTVEYLYNFQNPRCPLSLWRLLPSHCPSIHSSGIFSCSKDDYLKVNLIISNLCASITMDVSTHQKQMLAISTLGNDNKEHLTLGRLPWRQYSSMHHRCMTQTLYYAWGVTLCVAPQDNRPPPLDRCYRLPSFVHPSLLDDWQQVPALNPVEDSLWELL